MAGKVTTTLAERLWPKVQVTDGCWTWTGGATPKGYGHITRDGRQVGVHRVVYELANGPIPDGMQLDHLCRNPSCVRPDHLEPVTCRENLARGTGFVADQLARTHCPKGHPYSGDNLYVAPSGSRGCRICVRERNRIRKAARARRARV